jgi:4-diphosphocytidyl-2-C-methyl-D-erythritol kinase
MLSSGHWPAPAKINLFLHIIGRRADGYHLLQTVFQFLDYGDELDFELTGDGSLQRQGFLPGVAPEQDLILRAARALRQASGTQFGAVITLRKQLPMGGGLGGGSSDAATTLVALNHLWRTGLSLDQLAEIGLRLGADVPVFVRGQAAWAEGVGERITPLPDLPIPWYLVVVPACQVSTADIFSAPELTRDAQALKIPAFLRGQGGNVCEPVVRSRYPEVAQAIDWLSQYAPTRMSGTGACIFAAFDTEAQAQAIARQIPTAWRGFVAKGLNESPLHRRLAVEASSRECIKSLR